MQNRRGVYPNRHLNLTALAVVASIGALGAAAAALAAPLGLKASVKRTGWVSLSVSGQPGSEVVIREGEAEVARVQLGGESATVAKAAPWRCDRLVRTFTVTDPSGATAQARVRTPSCRKRLGLSVRAVKRGRRKVVAVRVVDRFKVGDATARVCVRRPGARSAGCRALAVPRGRDRAALSYTARKPGLWKVSMSSFGQRLSDSAFVVPRGGLRLLATGDSMIQIVDVHLKRRLARTRVRVRSDARVSTGISKPFLLDWVGHARRQARSRPAATVVFLGANEGFPIGGVNCCSDGWADRYAARAERMMRSYSRSGAGQVYWLTLPVPRPGQWKSIYRTVNVGIKRAAARVGDGVTVVDTARYFTPRGFRSAMRVGGRTVTVRQSDGVHLNSTGAALAAGLVQRAMRRDGLIR